MANSIFDRATSVFGSKEAAEEWLSQPQPGLGNEVPLDLLSTEDGTEKVEDLIGRIEYGVIT